MSGSGKMLLLTRGVWLRTLLKKGNISRLNWAASETARACVRVAVALVGLMLAPLPVCAASNGADAPPLGLALVMIEEHGCGYCQRWLEEVGPGYAASDEGRRAPLIRIDRFSKQAEQFPRVVYSPTFVLLREGQERGRILGYPGPDFFWSLLADLLRKLDAESAITAAPATAIVKP